MKKHIFACVVLSVAWSAGASADELVKVEINKGQMVHLSRAASSVVVADPLTADVQVVSPKLVFVHGKKIGETSLTVVDANDELVFEGTVEVTHNLSSLNRAVKRVAPDADINFKTVDGGLVMDGSAGSVQESENIRNVASAFVGKDDKLVNMVTSDGGDQVTLQVKIVEMARTDLKTLGINLQSSLATGGWVTQAINGPLSTAGLVSRATGADANILTSFTSSSGNTVSALVDALETNGLATVLAEPSLTTSTGKAASFLAGGQYPIPVRGQDGSVTVQYQPFGVSLNFTPVVMSKDRMSILVAPEVSTLNFSNPIQVAGFTYPILDTRKAQATVELGSGQTFALAGLLRNDTSNNLSKLPGVGDIPLLGALFRSTRFQNNQTELVILVTPYIVHPVSDAKKMQTPLDSFRPVGDTERAVLGSMFQQQDMQEKPALAAPQTAQTDSEAKPIPYDDDDLFENPPAKPQASKPVVEKPQLARPVAKDHDGFILE